MLTIYFDPSIIYIERESTSKCGDITGNELLDRMKLVFSILKNKYPQAKMKIRLDESKIEFFKEDSKEKTEIWLKWLYLFKSGQSWYNSKGYREIDYDQNTDLMNEFINKKVSDVYNEEEYANITEILRILDVSEEETIKTLFNKVCDILKTDKGNGICCKCVNLLDITIKEFKIFLTTRNPNNFMRTKFYELWFNPLEEKGGRKTRKRRVNKKKTNRSIKRKSNKKSMKKRKGKKTIKRRTKKHKK